MSAAAERPIVVAVTGASGAPYAVRLLETLVEREQRVSLIVSDHGLRLLETEMGIGSVAALRDARWRCRLGCGSFVCTTTAIVARRRRRDPRSSAGHGDLPVFDGHDVGDRGRVHRDRSWSARPMSRSRSGGGSFSCRARRRTARSISRTCSP